MADLFGGSVTTTEAWDRIEMTCMNAFAFSEQNSNYKKVNQDSALCATVQNQAQFTMHVVAVADGITNSFEGEFASREALRSLLDYLGTTQCTSAQQLAGGIEEGFFQPLNERLLAHRRGDAHSMTTFAAVVVTHSGNVIFHLGDTKAFYVRNSGRRDQRGAWLTEEHNISNAFKRQDSNSVPWIEAGHAGLTRWLGNPVTRLGVESQDLRGIIDNQDGIVLVMTDGLHGYLSEREIMGLLSRTKGDLQQFCTDCVGKALQNIGIKGNPNDDNVTIAALDIGAVLRDSISQPLWAGASDDTPPQPPIVKQPSGQPDRSSAVARLWQRSPALFSLGMVSLLVLIVAIGMLGKSQYKNKERTKVGEGATLLSNAVTAIAFQSNSSAQVKVAVPVPKPLTTPVLAAPSTSAPAIVPPKPTTDFVALAKNETNLLRGIAILISSPNPRGNGRPLEDNLALIIWGKYRTANELEDIKVAIADFWKKAGAAGSPRVDEEAVILEGVLKRYNATPATPSDPKPIENLNKPKGRNLPIPFFAKKSS